MPENTNRFIKFTQDYLIWIAAAVLGIYLLYSKGYIAADFVSVDVQSAYTMMTSEEQNITLVDVRTPEEYQKDGYIAGALLLPLGTLEKEIAQLDAHKDKKLLIYCRSGSRSVSASRILEARGFTVYNVKGGLNAWKKDKLPLGTE